MDVPFISISDLLALQRELGPEAFSTQVGLGRLGRGSLAGLPLATLAQADRISQGSAAGQYLAGPSATDNPIQAVRKSGRALLGGLGVGMVGTGYEALKYPASALAGIRPEFAIDKTTSPPSPGNVGALLAGYGQGAFPGLVQPQGNPATMSLLRSLLGR